jgi:hypothetical protein
LPISRTLPTDAAFDSLRLLLLPNGYSIGDTLSPFTINAHRLTQRLKTQSDGLLYNTSSFSYDPAIFGSLTYFPRPNTNDTISIPLNEDFGNELFNLLVEKVDNIVYPDDFYAYFKGIVLSYDNSNNAILGFKTALNMPVMRVYYHYFDFQTEYRYIDFPINEFTSLQFNQFLATNTVLDTLNDQHEKLPATNVGNKSYVQAGIGIVTRFEMPTLPNLLELHPNVQILKAELVMEPVKNSYKTLKLPEGISLFTSDNLNRFGSAISNPVTGDAILGKLVIDDVFQEETSYTFDVTDFVRNKIKEASDDVPCLLLTIKTNELFVTMDRLVLGSRQNKENNVKLKIYYMYYE